MSAFIVSPACMTRVINGLIVEHYGESTVETLASEILALTKVNWNSCAFCNSDPITIQFARSVGHILTELPKGVEPQTKYKFYM